MQKNNKIKKRILIIFSLIILFIFAMYYVFILMVSNAGREYGKTIYCRESTFKYENSAEQKNAFEDCMDKE